MNRRKRLLAISPRFLFPLDQGGKIRTANILRHLKGGAFKVTLASPAPADFHAFRTEIAAVCDRFISWPELRPSPISKMAALLGALPATVAADRCQSGKAAVRRALNEASPDLLLVDFPHAAVLLPDLPLPPSIIFTHNVEAEIYERHAAVASAPMRFVWQREARKMRQFEQAALRRFNSVIAVSRRDSQTLRHSYGLERVDVVDTGVDLDFHARAPEAGSVPSNGGTVVFSGAMDWRANVDGIRFLMDEVWPMVLRRRGRARAVVVGRNPPPALVAAAKSRHLDWAFTGYVDDIRPYIAEGHVYVIPLRVGSGTRIKAFEAMATGRPVVSTTVGVEGLDVAPGQHLLVADDAPGFAAAILQLFDAPGLCRELANAARARLEQRFSWQHVARQFETICLRVADSHGRIARRNSVVREGPRCDTTIIKRRSVGVRSDVRP